MIKKITVFFAEGGSTVSWFTIQYPDPQGKARGQFGDAHCVFDCKYNLYNPRLDAITHYNLVNGICDKKFVEEKHYPGGVQAYLFRDAAGDCLQVLWWDEARGEHSHSLACEQDGGTRPPGRFSRHAAQRRRGNQLTCRPSRCCCSTRTRSRGWPDSLGPPALSLAAAPVAVGAAGTAAFTVQGPGLTGQSLRVIGPPLWTATVKPAGEHQVDLRRSGPHRDARPRSPLLRPAAFRRKRHRRIDRARAGGAVQPAPNDNSLVFRVVCEVAVLALGSGLQNSILADGGSSHME